MKKGDRVTDELKTWYDGRPKGHWPNPAYLGTVQEIAFLGGVKCAKVKYDSGRKDWVAVNRLTDVKQRA